MGTVTVIIIVIVLIAFGFESNRGVISTKKSHQKPIHKPAVQPPPVHPPQIQPTPIKSPYEEHFSNWKEQTIKQLDDSMSLSDLLIEKNVVEIVYIDLLSCFEWEFKRFKILLRDSYECKDCQVRDERNHVHHLHYIKDELPWEIEDSGLITLCYQCHKKRHESTDYQVFARINKKLIQASSGRIYCNRCGGIGYIPKYNHVQNGICFSCWGNLISKSVFSKVLSETHDNINNYNDSFKRTGYLSFMNQLTVSDFVNKVPNYQSYVKLPDIDLPF
ncbi:MAG: hypothetical protein ABSD71_02325 [Bacteroidales bacterium]